MKLKSPLQECDRCRGSGFVLEKFFDRNNPHHGLAHNAVIPCPQPYCFNGYVKEPACCCHPDYGGECHCGGAREDHHTREPAHHS